MRVTQSILSSNLLHNLSNSYNKMGKLQQQLTSGSKLTRPSDDPVATIKGMGYRTTLAKNEQFTRNMTEVQSYLDATDAALGQVGEGLKRIKELTVQASTDTVTPEDREKIRTEIDQIRQQFRDVANTQLGDKYIFSGSNTLSPVYPSANDNSKAGETIDLDDMGGNDEVLPVELYDGIAINMNTAGKDLFKSIDDMMSEIQTKLTNDDANPISADEISGLLTQISAVTDRALNARAEVGAKENRVEMMMDRLSSQKISVTKAMSDNEDVEYEETITQLLTEESIHRAALSVGSKIIQSTLVDFIR